MGWGGGVGGGGYLLNGKKVILEGLPYQLATASSRFEELLSACTEIVSSAIIV